MDLVFAADPDNCGVATERGRYESRVYWNTGEHSARQNHWIRLCFTGVTDAELIGARVEVSTAGKEQYRWIHSNHTYKSGGALDAHFGLGSATNADVTVTLLDGRTKAILCSRRRQKLHTIADQAMNPSRPVKSESTMKTTLQTPAYPFFRHTAPAQTAPSADTRFKHFDKNNDGRISAEELGMPAVFATSGQER